MNDESRIDNLTDDELEQVTGGTTMSCDTAKAIARGYAALDSVFNNVFGMYDQAEAFSFEGGRIVQGACPANRL